MGVAMTLPDYLDHVNQEIAGIVAPSFTTKQMKLNKVPATDSDALRPTPAGEFTAYRLKTTVLYVDIRRSVFPEVKRMAHDKIKVYLAFLKVMANAAEYHGGRVVDLAGDRMMVVFDEEDCYTDAINTAFLLNTVAQTILAPHFPHRTIRCGIGVDYGSILLSRVPVESDSEHRKFAQEMVWLGKPASRAAKLMAVANGSLTSANGVGNVGRAFHEVKEWSWRVLDEYTNMINVLGTRPMNVYTGPTCRLSKLDVESGRIEPILVTGRVLTGLRKERPDDVSLKRLWWRKKSLYVPNLKEEVFGANVIYTC